MQAGREIRVMVLPDVIDDDAMVLLSRDIAKEIEQLASSAETNAATAQQVSAVVQEQTAAMASVATSSQHLADVGERLKESLRRFEI